MGSRYLVDLADVLRCAGLTVHEDAGWQNRARSSGGFDPGYPSAVVIHHTASSAAPADDVAYISRNAEYAPIAQLLLDRNGEWWVCAAGAANHAGSGGPWKAIPADGANSRTIGVEAANAGTGERWPDVQQSSYVAGVAALCAAYTIDPANIMTHAEWAPTRKIDPAGPSRWASGGTWPGDGFRASVAAAGTPTASPWPKPDNTLSGDDVEWIQNAVYDVLNLWYAAHP